LLVISIVVSAIVAGLFFKDYRQVPYGPILTIIWLTASFMAFGFGIIYFAQFILPQHAGESWIEGVNMLLRSFLNSGPKPVRSKKSAEFPGEESLPSSFDTLQAGILRSYQALAINKGVRFARPAGPGYVRLDQGEIVSQLLDLRKHVRSQDVTAHTYDGIPLITNVRIVFRIKPSRQATVAGDLEYPYDEKAIFQVSQANSVDENNELLLWSEQLAPQAASYLVSEVAQFALNELSEEPNLLVGIQSRVRRMLRSNFDNLGIKIIDVIVTMHDLPYEIKQYRLAIWRSSRESEIREEEAKKDAEVQRRMKRAQSQAQVEITDDILTNIARMRRIEGISLSQVVYLCVMGALDEAISNQPDPPEQFVEDYMDEEDER
jgi:regulator of protease activity HflC (stomatin/prohibitin superfamily)